MYEAVPNPNWVARPGAFARSHEAGRSVDVTTAMSQHPWSVSTVPCLSDMGTDFDDFSPRSFAFATDGISTQQRANRERLRDAMSAGGLTVLLGGVVAF